VRYVTDDNPHIEFSHSISWWIQVGSGNSYYGFYVSWWDARRLNRQILKCLKERDERIRSVKKERRKESGSDVKAFASLRGPQRLRNYEALPTTGTKHHRQQR